MKWLIKLNPFKVGYDVVCLGDPTLQVVKDNTFERLWVYKVRVLRKGYYLFGFRLYNKLVVEDKYVDRIISLL